ncbi:hypothetical protein [Spirosoma aerolatum]|uniref:hypothetical protein n=1 Tax=Spirosoma aerolatum TaxID=1211326 RepID=UPI0009ABCDA9|nr:hypothetical protein [Spirosoma aerolatum]
MLQKTDLPFDSPPTPYEIQYAKVVLRRKAAHQKRIVDKYYEMVALLVKHERKATLSIQFSEKGEMWVVLEQHDCSSFHLYDSDDWKELKEGFGLIQAYIVKGVSIPYYSMIDKRLNISGNGQDNSNQSTGV